MNGELNDKQRRFVDEYLIDSNQTQAAIRAGYSPKTAAAQGNRLLKNVKIAALLEQKKAKLNNKLEITQEKVLQEIARTLGMRKVFRSSIPKNCQTMRRRPLWRYRLFVRPGVKTANEQP